MAQLTPFHVAIPVYDIELARTFYRDILQCPEGRSDKLWVDFNLYGHQFVIHYQPKSDATKHHHNPVDGHSVPIPHYGVILKWDDWEKLSKRLIDLNVEFVIDPHIRFKGQSGEQATMFFLDPCGNALEFKSFKDFGNIFL